MRQRVIDRVARENDLRQAVEQSLLEVHYQPIVDLAIGRDLRDSRRWPVARPVASGAPTEFIEIAEETG